MKKFSDPTAFEIRFDPTQRRMSGWAIHGDTPFDVTFISEITPNLWQGGCEKGLVLPAHIDHLVSLYPWEQYKVNHELKSSLTVRMLDSTSQAMDQVIAIAQWVNIARQTGTVLVHCQAGLNRSGLVATTALLLDDETLTPDAAIRQVREARAEAVLCNTSFEQWIRTQFADR